MKRFLLIMMGLGIMMVSSAKDINVSDVLDHYMSAWNAHDLKKIDGFYGDEVIWYDLSYDHTTRGKKHVSKAITDAFMGYVPDMYWAQSGDVFVSENTIIYEWVYGGTFNGECDGQKIDNKRFEIKGLSTTTINEKGKIISHKDYYDLLGFKKQLGLIK